jgi:hypothetical protein
VTSPLLTVTKFICISTAVFLIGYDIIPFLAPERGDTISEVIAKWGLHLFSLPFTFGVLCGHFFFLRDDAKPQPKILILLALIVILMDVLGSVFNLPGLSWIKEHPPIPFMLGIPIGTWLWPQSRTDKM